MSKSWKHKIKFRERLIISLFIIITAAITLGCAACFEYFEENNSTRTSGVPAVPERTTSVFQEIHDADKDFVDKSQLKDIIMESWEYTIFFSIVVVIFLILLGSKFYRNKEN